MRTLLFVAGWIIVTGIMLEVLWTTMGTGGGWLTKRLTSTFWKTACRLYRMWGAHLLLTWTGILIVFFTFLVWVFVLWTGWLLIFQGDALAVLQSQSKAPAPFWARVYFVGFTLFTLGTGDYIPNGDLWQVLTVVASLNGLFLVTFSITYFVPVVQAATHMRRLAVFISSLGLTPQRMLLNTWEDGSCCGLEAHLTTLAQELAYLEQQHLAYPVLHYFHTRARAQSVPLSLATLDEALTLLDCGLADRCGVRQARYHPVRQVVTEYLETLDSAFIHAARQAPPPPSLEPLRAAGLPVVDDDVFAERVRGLSDRRCLLRGLVEQSAWPWRLVERQDEGPDPTLPLSKRRAA